MSWRIAGYYSYSYVALERFFFLRADGRRLLVYVLKLHTGYENFIRISAMRAEAAEASETAPADRAILTGACYRVGLDVVWPVVRQSEVVPAI